MSKMDNVSKVIADRSLMVNILSRLPIKSLLRFKCMSKSWLELIESRDFGRMHFERSAEEPSLILTTTNHSGRNFFTVDMPSIGDHKETVEAIHWLTTKWNHPMSKSVNGLLLVEEFGANAVRIFNPTTGKLSESFKTTFKMGVEKMKDGVKISRMPHFGFGCDRDAKEHKVVCVWEMHTTSADHVSIGVERVCEVMTVGHNTWRRIEAVPPFNVRGDPINVDGALYWLSAGENLRAPPKCDYLVFFDVESEKFLSTRIAIQDNCTFVTLLEVSNRIAILRKITDGPTLLFLMVSSSKLDCLPHSISMPFHWDGKVDPNFENIPGTPLFLMKSMNKKGSAVMYLYDYHFNETKEVEVVGLHSLKKSHYSYNINTIRRSLLAVD